MELVMFFNKKITVKDKLDFLEYLSFQVKSEASFEETLTRYLGNGSRKDYVSEYCLNAISDIKNGNDPADALLDNGFISNLEYGIIKNADSSNDLHNSLISIININKNSLKNNNTLGNAVKSGLLTIMAVFLIIPFYKDDIASLYQSFGQMQAASSTSSTSVINVELPFLIKYWWSSFIVIGAMILLYFGIKYFLNFIYINYTSYYYKVFKNKLYTDLITVLNTYYQLQNSMNISNAYIALSKTSPNIYWRNIFYEIDLNLKEGGKASDILVSQKGILPLEVINCFIDADETGETELYIKKALDYCENRDKEINEVIKEWGPAVINVLIYLLVGLLAVAFVKDTMQHGILDVLSGM